MTDATEMLSIDRHVSYQGMLGEEKKESSCRFQSGSRRKADPVDAELVKLNLHSSDIVTT